MHRVRAGNLGSKDAAVSVGGNLWLLHSNAVADSYNKLNVFLDLSIRKLSGQITASR